MRARTAVAVGFALVVAAGAAWCAHAARRTASARLERMFGVDTSSRETVRAAFLERVPAGTTTDSVVAYLEGHRVGVEPDTWVKRETDEVRCTIWSAKSAMEFASPKAWIVVFRLDPAGRVRDVEVKWDLVVL